MITPPHALPRYGGWLSVVVAKGASVLTDVQRSQLAVGPTATYVIGQLFESLNYGGDPPGQTER